MENEKLENNYDFLTHPKNFKAYKWYKPLLVLLLTAVFFLILSNCMSVLIFIIETAQGHDASKLFAAVKGGYDSFNAYTLSGALFSLGSLAIFIPSLLFASLIVGDRPFSSYSSAKGGWRMKVFLKCFGLCLIVSTIPVAIHTIINSDTEQNVQFTVAGFIVCTILAPFQCIAEEYIFRSLALQTFTSWFRIRVIAVIISSLLFMSMHPYNTIGKIEILLTGAAMCIMAWIGNGIEASSAIHITNNMTIFYLAGFGIDKVSQDSTIDEIIVTVAIDIVYIAILLFVRKKFHWFDAVKKDDVTPFNEKYEKKLEAKAAKKLN